MLWAVLGRGSLGRAVPIVQTSVLTCSELRPGALRELLGRFRLGVTEVAPGEAIPGSYWGEPEAGIRGQTLFVRPDTPVHSALHEACHLICADRARRERIDTDAGGSDLEESGVCYLQVLLADEIPGVGRDQLMADMDAWGYSFRLGSTRAWFEEDAEDARTWLREEGLIDPGDRPTFRPRS